MEIIEQDFNMNDSNDSCFNKEDELFTKPAVRYATMFMYGTLVSLSMVFNLLVLTTIVARLRLPHFVLIAMLSISDLWLIGVSGTITPLHILNDNKWHYGASSCRLVPWIQGTCMSCSIYLLTAIAVDRHAAIVRRLKRPFGLRTIVIAVCIILLCSFLLASAPAWHTTLRLESELSCSTHMSCQQKWHNNYLRILFGVTCFIVQLLLPMGVIAYSYCMSVFRIQKMADLRGNMPSSNIRLALSPVPPPKTPKQTDTSANEATSSTITAKRHLLTKMSITELPESIKQLVDSHPPVSPRLSTLASSRLGSHSSSSCRSLRRVNHKLRRLRRTNMVLVSMIATFVFCWTPLKLMQLLNDLNIDVPLMNSLHNHLMHLIAHWLAMLSTVTNPLLYGIFNHRVREVMSARATPENTIGLSHL